MNLQPGQIIVALNGTLIKNTQDLINYLKYTIPNQTLIVTLKIGDTLKNIFNVNTIKAFFIIL